MKSKKAMTMQFVSIFGVIIFLIGLFAVLSLGGRLWGAVTGEKTVIDTVYTAAQNTEIGSDPVVLGLGNGEAVVGFTPGSGLLYQPDGTVRGGFTAENAGHLRGVYMKKPSTCGDTQTCLCTCEVTFQDLSTERVQNIYDVSSSISIPDGEIICEEPRCRAYEKDLYEPTTRQVFQGRAAPYPGYHSNSYEGGWILLRADIIQPFGVASNGLPVDAAGYTNFLWEEHPQVVFVNKDFDNQDKLYPCLRQNADECVANP